MANRYPQRTTPHNWAPNGAAVWCDADDDTPDSTFADGDTAVFTPNSNVVTVDAPVLVTDFTLDGVGLAGSADIIANGNISGAGSATNNWTGTLVQQGTGTIAWNEVGDSLTHVRLAWGIGVTSTFTNHIRTDKFGHGAGTVDLDGNTLYIDVADNDFWEDGTGDVLDGSGGGYVFLLNYPTKNQGALSTVDVKVVARGLASAILTMTGDWDLGAGDFEIYPAADGTCALAVNANDLTATGTITLGHATDADRIANLIFTTGTFELGTIVAGAAGAVGVLILGVADGVVTSLDGTNITVTASGARIKSGTVSNVTCTGRLIAWACTDGGSNSISVEFAPRQIGTMPMAA